MTNSAAFDLRLKRIMQGMPASGDYTGPATLGSPTDRGPAPVGVSPSGQVIRKLGAATKKKPDAVYA